MDPVSAGLMVAGKLVQGVGALKAGNANSEALKRQAQGELRAGAEEEARVREAARADIGAQVAAQFGNGLEGVTGSALDAVKESLINARLDALTIRRDARVKSDELLTRARQEKLQGRLGAAGAILGAAGQAYGMSQDWADARRGRRG